eukprot:TRINITY_DN10392_c0_g1_i1.p1 TRINITY_DN10392_c0_g1~~TRINITY_DN10392_c0_g1_i1.p1  ORF type:complete len:317 (-),score=129.50 TRINITY_DN10392_c0_g1_i1:35-985(-)
MMKTLDLSTIPSTSSSRTVSLVNSFVISTSQFLNKFSFICEKKLSEVSRDIQRLEITMNLLEAKLASIPGLDGISAPPMQEASSDVSSAPNHVRFAEEPSYSSEATGGPPPPPPPPGTFSSSAPIESDNSGPKVKDDPEYAGWFRKLKAGVSEQAIRNGMELAGLDPDLISTPDAPLPPRANKKNEKVDQSSDEESEEESNFSPPPPPPFSHPTPKAKEEEDSEEESSSVGPPPPPVFSSAPPPPPPSSFAPPPPPGLPSAQDEEDDDDDDDDDEENPSVPPPSLPMLSPPPFLPPPMPRPSASDDDDDDDDDDDE